MQYALKKESIMFTLIVLLIAIFTVFYILKTAEVNNGRKIAEKKYAETKVEKFKTPQALQKLSILPLIDSESADENLKTENGVSYLVQADDKEILLDIGFNKGKEHPSPLLHNMSELGKSFDEIDYLVFSHLHLDHVGGMAEQKAGKFSLSQGKVETPDIPVYAPAPLAPSEYNPQFTKITVSEKPTEIMPGAYTIGTIPRQLFLIGYIEEQALAFNLADKGIVLLIGCGHQTIQRILERTKALFDLPIYAVIGGLHLPLKGETFFSKIQYLLGSDYAPPKGLKEQDVYNAIESLRKADVQIVALSPHDSTEWSIQQFRDAFGEKYVDVKVGKEILL